VGQARFLTQTWAARLTLTSRGVDTVAVNSADAFAERDAQPLESVLGAERVFTLYRVSKLVSASLDLDATLQAITDASHELTNAHQTALFLVDDQGGLELRAGRGPIATLTGQHLPADQGVLGRALSERQVIVVDDMQLEPSRARPDLDEQFNVRGYLVAPLIWRGEVLGAVTTAARAPGALGRAEVLLVSELAEQAASAVAHARNYADAQERRAFSDELVRQFTEQAVQLDRAQLHLVQNEKMTAVGQLVQGLAHEMNTPLNVVTSNMSVLSRYTTTLSTIARASASSVDDDLEFILEDLPALIEDSTTATQRVAAIVWSMGSLARHDRGSQAPVALEETLEAALTLASNSLKKNARLVRNLAPVPAVLGHSTELIEVFVHLLLNAAQALEERAGTVTVETIDAAPWVIVRISDTGEGIAPDLQQRVFDPFFTTRANGQGAGMGLAVSRGIVNRHGGEISLDSTPGVGTTLTVRLPATGVAQAQAA
jgi:signal transduction histidine kinase